jgi:hypothetical protein
MSVYSTLAHFQTATHSNFTNHHHPMAPAHLSPPIGTPLRTSGQTLTPPAAPSFFPFPASPPHIAAAAATIDTPHHSPAHRTSTAAPAGGVTAAVAVAAPAPAEPSCRPKLPSKAAGFR